jgi:hypothetical protein
MKYIILIIIIIIILVYGRYYLKYNKDIKILQVNLDNLDLNILYEKYPILIYDQVYDHDQLLKTIFNYSIQYSVSKDLIPSIPIINKSKYLLISSAEDTNSIINIINPKYNNEAKKRVEFLDTKMQYVSIKLKPKQVIILPSRWIYQSYDNVHITGLDDILSIIFLNMMI